MLIKLVGSAEQVKELARAVDVSLEELGLTGTIPVQVTEDVTYIQDLKITKFPALAIEEEALQFKDMIFEGIVPPQSEMTSMFVSILGGTSSAGSCGVGGCGSCSSGGCSSGIASEHSHQDAGANCGCL